MNGLTLTLTLLMTYLIVSIVSILCISSSTFHPPHPPSSSQYVAWDFPDGALRLCSVGAAEGIATTGGSGLNSNGTISGSTSTGAGGGGGGGSGGGGGGVGGGVDSRVLRVLEMPFSSGCVNTLGGYGRGVVDMGLGVPSAVVYAQEKARRREAEEKEEAAAGEEEAEGREGGEGGEGGGDGAGEAKGSGRVLTKTRKKGRGRGASYYHRSSSLPHPIHPPHDNWDGWNAWLRRRDGGSSHIGAMAASQDGRLIVVGT